MSTSNDPEHEAQPFHNQAATVLSINTLHYNKQANSWTVSQDIDSNSIKFELNNGVETDVLTKAIYNELHQRPRLSSISIGLIAYNGTNIPVQGKCKVSVNYKKVVTPIMFIIADTNLQPVLSITARKYQDCFSIYTPHNSWSYYSTCIQAPEENSLCTERQIKIWTQQNGNHQVSQQTYRMDEFTCDYGET